MFVPQKKETENVSNILTVLFNQVVQWNHLHKGWSDRLYLLLRETLQRSSSNTFSSVTATVFPVVTQPEFSTAGCSSSFFNQTHCQHHSCIYSLFSGYCRPQVTACFFPQLFACTCLGACCRDQSKQLPCECRCRVVILIELAPHKETQFLIPLLFV